MNRKITTGVPIGDAGKYERYLERYYLSLAKKAEFGRLPAVSTDLELFLAELKTLYSVDQYLSSPKKVA